MFSSWFSKAMAPAASSAPETSTTKTTAAAPVPSTSARQPSTPALSPPRAVPQPKNGSSATAISASAISAYNNFTTIPPSISRTGSFSSTASASSNDSMISATDKMNDPTFSYAYGFVEPRTSSAFLSDDELRFDGNDDPAYRAARLSTAYNSNSSRNTLYRPLRTATRPARIPRSSGRVRMNAINEE